ncbi:MAG TPA: type II toxin-antitoxin system VapC family toxin [Lacipirellulaceae bacterium]|nr:type II toxin-antitoxin system VapC family toxin [Lacipirellulaceae bacterium]HMP07837.1 type II toxin-antitoxin system VapC family toxin [Lacipirellulaceae bacterium]
MRLLLDTHALLWFANGDNRLDPYARETIITTADNGFVSVASIWEIAIKLRIGKLQLDDPFEEFLDRHLQPFSILPIALQHAAQTASLPLHHQDPFDRLLAAQALTESLTLVSVDGLFDAYGVTRLWSAAPRL